MKTFQVILYICIFSTLTFLGCNKSLSWNQITFLVTDMSGDSKNRVVFKGEKVIYDGDYIRIEIDQCRYTILQQHRAEDKQYIYVPLVQSGGGSGIFCELQVIDKNKRVTTDFAVLGDRIQIKQVSVSDNIITVKYSKHSKYGEKMPVITNRYKITDGKLTKI